MSGIFISYSRRDSAQALDLQQRLHREGFRSVFLDTDPEQGIAAGDEWERRLYAKLRSCRALIALSSAAFAESKWCFAEVTHAKALGKSVFPLLVDSSNAHELIRDKQTIDVGPQATDVNAAYQRLFRGLHEAGIVKGGWDARRPPYPGLAAFEAEDAPVFFGRESAVEEALSRLERLHRYQTVAWFLLLGASGSGKSSLLRAGVIPRLSSPSPQWIVVGPMIPGAEPLQQCAREFSKTFASLGVTRDWKELRDVLERGDPRELSELAGDLRDAAKSEAKILLAIDQLEELLPFEREEGFQEGERELLLKRLLQLTSLEARAFLVVGTLRADFLGLFQDQSALRELPADKLVVDPIARQDLRAVIEGPAQLASLSFDEGLVDQIIQETETTDALPLLAFALRELYERYGSDGRLEVREYRELGGLENAVSQAAEAVLKHRRLVHGGGVEVPLPEAESAALRRAFLALVRLGDQDQPVRQPARWASLPDEAKPVLEEFVKARLLIFTGEGERELRVAHEALFRRWAVLVAWIEGARELLRWRHRTAPLIEVWERANRDPGSLLRGAALSEAMLIQQREDQLLLPAERAFVEAGQAQQKAERERAQRTARRTAVAALGVALVLGVLGVFAWGQRGEAQARANEAVINASKAETNARRAGLAARVAEAQARNNSTYAAATLREVGGTVPSDLESQALVALAHVVTNVVLEGHEQSVTSAVFSHDGKKILTASYDGTARIWNADGSGQPIILRGHENTIDIAAFSHDDKKVLTASRDGTARVWNADGSGQAIILDRGVGSAAFSPDGKKVLTLSDSTIHIWNADGSSQPIVISGHEAAIISAAFSTDGKKVATTSWDNTVRVWDADGSGEGVILTKEESRSHAPVFSPDGKKVLTSLEDNTARIWNVDGSGQPVILRGHEGTIYSAVFSPDGQSVLTASVDKTARVWNADGSGQANILRGHESSIGSAVYNK
ncbi:MAG TPA: TIR domain-containing protein, partial [Polyangiaceae bacterium]|nr:TIR domain-containing protein [Polyangiaceae bacterium]